MLQLFFFILFVSAVILVFGLAQILLLRQLNRVWWDKKWIRRSAYTLPLVGIVGIILLGMAEYNRVSWLSAVTSPLVVLAIVMEISLMLSLPISGVFNLTDKFIRRRRQSQAGRADRVSDPRRRVLLRGAAALVPAATISLGIAGVGRAYACAEVTLKTFGFDNLPPDLEGLRLLHLSDIHLRHYVTLDDLQEILAQAAAYNPDLVLVTGDIADDLTVLPDALRLIARSRSRLGSYAVLGNHEHFRGVALVRRIFDSSEVPLLVDESVSLTVGRTSLTLGGIDDPRSMRSIPPGFFQNSISASLGQELTGDFSILMSHRPNAFDEAARRGVHLTLSGHTHGGQVGFGGRSLLESSYPHSYLWGHYRKNGSHLYTSSGAGHWFPFRLGCPTEAPVIELRST